MAGKLERAKDAIMDLAESGAPIRIIATEVGASPTGVFKFMKRHNISTNGKNAGNDNWKGKRKKKK